MDKIKKIEQAMNDYIIETNGENSTIYNNIGLFYDLSVMIEEILLEFSDMDMKEEDYLNITKISLFDGIELIKKFYNDYNIEFDIETYLSDGTINFNYYDEFSEIDNTKYVSGINYYKDNQKLVDCCNNGLITDILVLVHELSHLRNQPDINRNEVSDLLTEALAYADELIFMDYLKTIGFEKDISLFKKHIFHMFYCNAKDIRPIYKMFLLYECMGSISKDNYELFYGDREYEFIIEYMLELSEKKKFNLYFESWFIFASILGSYMYQQYKTNFDFINTINLLHKSINNSSVLECLNIIGLNDLGEEDKEIIGNSLIETIKKDSKQLKKII